jgi:spermidine synthase
VHPAAAGLLTLVFFASGFSALLFETLWFGQAGLTFGGSVSASALVLSSFMGGMAVGNGLAARLGHRIRSPIRFFAVLELAIGIAGLALVLLLPRATPFVAEALRPFLDSAPLLRVARFVSAFGILAIPAIAMGATLPVLVRAFAPSGRDFGRVLGWLYGCNTLGAVAGAVTSESVWIPAAGVIGTGCIAATVDASAAALALVAARFASSAASSDPPAPAARPGRRALGPLMAAFLSGAALLALEVIWFRMIVLLVPQTTVVFGWMLGVVLLGIALGSLIAVALLRVHRDLDRYAGAIAFAAGAAVVASYAAYPAAAARFVSRNVEDPYTLVPLCAALMLPTSLLSGVIFTLLGRRLYSDLGSDTGSAGLLALSNTLGAMLGPLAASFVLLPRIGVERSLWLLAAVYGAVGLCALAPTARAGRVAQGSAAALFVGALAVFPSGAMQRVYDWVQRATAINNEERVARYEGVNETLVYTRMTFLGEPYSYRLITDGYSMSGTGVAARYMSLFADIPYAFHARPRHALLISYGVGITADALLSEPELELLDVVDISRDILRMSPLIVNGGGGPLADPRVRIHVEDGRYFLQIAGPNYDVITGEPPPPAAAGVVNLYTREYFSLLRSRLRRGGIASYWLPVGQLAESEAQAITAAFCGAFPDCSLWEGTPIDWILIGSRDASDRLTEEEISRAWSQPERRERLRAMAVEKPEQLAALFLADADFLIAWSNEVPLLVDNWPQRAPRWRLSWNEPPGGYAAIMDDTAARERFARSRVVARLWPASLREASLPYFRIEAIARQSLLAPDAPLRMYDLHRLLTQTDLQTLPLWLVNSDADKQRIAARASDADASAQGVVAYHLGARALGQRDYAAAAEQFDRSASSYPEKAPQLALYALAIGGRLDEVDDRARDERWSVGARPSDRSYWSFMTETFGIQPPLDPAL